MYLDHLLILIATMSHSDPAHVLYNSSQVLQQIYQRVNHVRNAKTNLKIKNYGYNYKT